MYHPFDNGIKHRRLRLKTQRRGVVSLELAILAVPFFMLALGTMEVGYDFFVQAALSNAVNVAARSVQVGSAQASATGAAEAAFVKSSVCPALGRMLDCGQLYVSITAIPSGVGQNYYTYLAANPPNLTTMASTSDSVCTGGAAQMMLLRAYYVSPTFIGMLVPSWSQNFPAGTGPRVHVTYGSAGFVNEYFAGGEAC
jgi:Flp pilus assembly protein TadG